MEFPQGWFKVILLVHFNFCHWKGWKLFIKTINRKTFLKCMNQRNKNGFKPSMKWYASAERLTPKWIRTQKSLQGLLRQLTSLLRKGRPSLHEIRLLFMIISDSWSIPYGLVGLYEGNNSSWSPHVRREYQLKQLANRRSYHKNSNPNDAAVGEIDLNAVFYPRENAVVIQPHDVINSGLIAFGNSEAQKSYAENLERKWFDKRNVWLWKESKVHFKPHKDLKWAKQDPETRQAIS